jgi:hypothetical protein
MSTATKAPPDNGLSPVPDHLREAYDALASDRRVNDEVALYWRTHPDPTPDGALEVRHAARLARAEEKLVALARGRQVAEDLRRMNTCPGCGGPNTGRTAWTALCVRCQLTALLMEAEDYEREVLDGRFRGAGAEVTRRELMALHRKEHPDTVLRPYLEPLR